MGWIKDSGLTVAKKTNNHPRSMTDKVEIRRRLLDAIADAAVLDCFAGAGKMHREVWRLAADYVACDLKWYRDDRLAYVADNRRLLRSIDLRAFSVFDLDAYGSPWEAAMIIAARRQVLPGERVAFAITDGSSLKIKMGRLPAALAELSGMASAPAGASRSEDEIVDRALLALARRMRCTIVSRAEARGKTGAGVRYIGIVLQGLPA